MVTLRGHIQQGGSCAAEAFFVANQLLESGLVQINDLSLGVFKNHGEAVRIGFVGRETLNPGHAMLFVTISGKTYELNFRMNRADENPVIEAVTEESFGQDRLKWVLPITEALVRYGEELSDDRGRDVTLQNCATAPRDSLPAIKFDEDF